MTPSRRSASARRIGHNPDRHSVIFTWASSTASVHPFTASPARCGPPTEGRMAIMTVATRSVNATNIAALGVACCTRGVQ